MGDCHWDGGAMDVIFKFWYTPEPVGAMEWLSRICRTCVSPDFMSFSRHVKHCCYQISE